MHFSICPFHCNRLDTRGVVFSFGCQMLFCWNNQEREKEMLMHGPLTKVNERGSETGISIIMLVSFHNNLHACKTYIQWYQSWNVCPIKLEWLLQMAFTEAVLYLSSSN